MLNILSMQDLDLSNKTVLIREDLNVPIKEGMISSDIRIRAALPTIKKALSQGAGVVVCSHLGRPSEGQFEAKYSLKPVADYLADLLGFAVGFCADYLANPPTVKAGEVVVLENVRFNVGEKANDENLAKAYANLCDVFVMDAFGTAHRAQASTAGVIVACKAMSKPVCAGSLLHDELVALGRALDNPNRPVLAIVGGSKVSTKLDVLYSLSELCDEIIVGGGIANTFLAASGVNVGASLYEPDLVTTAQAIMQKTKILLPSGVVVAKKQAIDFENFLGSLEQAEAVVKSVDEIGDDEMILDVDEASAKRFAEAITNAKTILWNGPVGVFEVDQFGQGTRILAQAVAQSAGFSIAGGGDTLAAIDKYQVADGVDYLSTGGGAFLEFVEGKALPAIVALTQDDCSIDV